MTRPAAGPVTTTGDDSPAHDDGGAGNPLDSLFERRED